MLLDWTTHTGSYITDHLGINITFDKYNWVRANANISINLDVDASINKEGLLQAILQNASHLLASLNAERYTFTIISIQEILNSYIGKETPIASGYLNNHLNNILNDNLGNLITFYSPIKFENTFEHNAQLIKDKIINSNINIDFNLNAIALIHKILNSNIETIVGLNGDIKRESNLQSTLLTTQDLTSILTRYKLIEANIDYDEDIKAMIMKRYGTFDIIMVKFKE